MANAMVQIQMDSETKEEVEALYARMGTSFAEAVRIFAVQSILAGGLPLTVRAYPDKVYPDKPVQKHTAYGRLAKYANPELIKKESEAFALAMEEKYRDTD